MSKNKRESDFSEIKTFYADLEVKEDESNEEMGVFTGHANTYKIDSVRDIVEPGSFKKTISETGNKRALFFMHNVTDIKALMGGALNLEEDGTGLFTRGELMLEFEDCRKAYRAIQKKFIDRMSIGLRVVKAWYEEVEKQYIRHITELKLMEISLCPIGMAANDGALIDSWKNSENIFKFFIENREDKMLKNKILSFYGIEPETILTLKPDTSTLKPEIDTTRDAKSKQFNIDFVNRWKQLESGGKNNE